MAKPVLLGITAKDHTIVYKFDQVLNNAIFVQLGEFYAEGNGGLLVFTFVSGVTFGDSVYLGVAELIPTTLLNNRWEGESIQNSLGESPDPVINQLAINNSTGVDNTKPTFVGGIINLFTADFYFSEVFNPAVIPAANSFNVFLDGIQSVGAVVQIYGTRITVIMGTPAKNGQVPTAQYINPGVNSLQDLAGNQVDSFAPQNITNITPADAQGLYINYNSLRSRWGTKNIQVASNKDGTAGTDFGAVQEWIDFAEEEVHSVLDGGPYLIPLVLNEPSKVPTRVKEWCHVIAYEHGYNARGTHEEKTRVTVVGAGNRLSQQLREVYQQMALVRSGLINLRGVQFNPDFDSNPLVITADNPCVWGCTNFSWDVVPYSWWSERW